MGIIYKYTSPSGKSYVGKTKYDRKTRERKDAKGYLGCTAFYKAILYYGLENFTYEILEECDNEILGEREHYYIELLNTRVPNGYNIQDGSEHTKTWSKKVYQFEQDGTLIAEYESLTEAAQKNQCNVASLSEVCTGRKSTCKGFLWSYSPEPPKPKKNCRNRRIYQFDEEGNLIKEFEDAKNAANFYKIPINQIRACASKNKQKRVGDSIFTYEPFVDWNYYALKHKRSSTTIPNGSRIKQSEVRCSENNNSDEDIV